MGAISELSLVERIARLETEIAYDEPRALNIADAMLLAQKRELLKKLKEEMGPKAAPVAVASPSQPPVRKKARAPVRTGKVVALATPGAAVLAASAKITPPEEPVIEQFEGERYLAYRHPESGRPTGKMMTWEQAIEHQKAGRLILRK
jgi:hypothetical protein